MTIRWKTSRRGLLFSSFCDPTNDTRSSRTIPPDKVISPIPSAKISRLTAITDSKKTGSTAAIAFLSHVQKAKTNLTADFENKLELQAESKSRLAEPRSGPIWQVATTCRSLERAPRVLSIFPALPSASGARTIVAGR